MASPGLTRDDIALSILNGLISTLGRAEDASGGLEYLEGPPELTLSLHRRICVLAFQLADAFIRERDPDHSGCTAMEDPLLGPPGRNA